MTSMHDALTDALEHPQEYHPQRPRPLGKKGERPAVPESWVWGAIGACAGLAVMLYAMHRSRG